MMLSWLSDALLFSACVLSSSASQLNLSPVYGSIPSAIFHTYGLITCTILPFMLGPTLTNARLQSILKVIPLYAFSVPTLQDHACKHSLLLGARYGPLAAECLTLYPLIYLTFFRLNQSALHVFWPIRIVLLSLFCAVFYYAEVAVLVAALPYIGSNAIVTRAGLQYLAAVLYSFILPSYTAICGLVVLLATVNRNVHFPTHSSTVVLNSALQRHDWVLLERRESNTGYLSVLENKKDQYRVLRCDHSLLGGEWLLTPERVAEGMLVQEPVYSVFTMLESVRLMAHESKSPNDSQASMNALVIGLGIGTSPKAFISHGIDTTTVELDPIVHEFATKYFDLPRNHTSIIDNAERFVQKAVQTTIRYDYILHDVFTGGVEPVELFTIEFLSALRSLLKAKGFIAINYAGDLDLPSTQLVVHTVKSVFPLCRLFRDSPQRNGSQSDFVNLVIFCSASNKPWSFRAATEADFLKSRARRDHIPPKIEVEWKKTTTSSTVLSRANMHKSRIDKRNGAISHWNIMRTVLPDVVWEMW